MSEYTPDAPKTGSSFGTVGKLIAASNNKIAGRPKGVVLLTAGNITVIPVGNEDNAPLAFTGLPAGYIIPFRVKKVTALSGGATCASIED